MLTPLSPMGQLNDFFQPQGYRSQPQPRYSDQTGRGSVIWQPDVYRFASALAGALHRLVLIDVGCGDGEKLVAQAQFETIGIDFGPNIARCRSTYPHRTWIEHDLDRSPPLPRLERYEQSVLICSDAIEHLGDPRVLLRELRLQVDLGAVASLDTGSGHDPRQR